MQRAFNAVHLVRLFDPTAVFKSSRTVLRDLGSVRHAYSRPWFLNGDKTLRKPPTTVHKFPESGDKKPAPVIKGDEVVPVLRDSKLLQNVPDGVRRLYTLSFATGKERVEYRRRDMCRQCGIDEFDRTSLAARIVDKTLEIRTGYEHVARNHKDRRGVRRIRRKIEERSALIHELLETNSAQVKKLSDALGIEYKSPTWPLPAEWVPSEMQQRKTAVVREAMRTRAEKLRTYKEALEAELERFDARRAEQVAAIDAELRTLPSGGVTGARELLQEIVAERREHVMQSVYEDRYARLLNLYERGVQAKEDAARAHNELREAKINEKLVKHRQTLAKSDGAAAPAKSVKK